MKIKFQLFYVFCTGDNDKSNKDSSSNIATTSNSSSNIATTSNSSSNIATTSNSGSDEWKRMTDMIDRYQEDRGSIDVMLQSFPLGFNVNGESASFLPELSL